MADIVLPVPGENPNWGTKLNTAILRINQELEALGVRVSRIDSDLSSVTLRVTNLEGRVTQLEDNLEDEVRRIAADVIASDPTIIEAAENAVDEAVADLNIMQAYPLPGAGTATGNAYIPIEWHYKPNESRYVDTYSIEYNATKPDYGPRVGEVPILRPDKTLHPILIPDTFASKDYVASQVEGLASEQYVDAKVGALESADKLPSVFWARVAQARNEDMPVAIVWTGSSTTIGPDRYVGPTTLNLQEALWPEMTPTPVQQDQDANFTEVTTPGLHGYSAGHGGTTAQTYLTQAEMNRIADLKPAFIGHMVGSNDYANQLSPVSYKASILANLAYFDSVLTEPCVHVLFHAYAIPDFDPWAYSMDQYGQALREIADERGDSTIFVNLGHEYKKVGIPGADPLRLVGEDRVHQTPAGYEFMTTLVTRALLP